MTSSRPTSRKPWRIAGLLLVALLAGQARAAESRVVTTSRDTASLVSDVDSVAPGKPFHLGLRLRMQPGWHSYWSNPGDAGVPPELQVTGVKAGGIVFPAPERLQEGPFTSFAYTGEVLLPVTATATGPAQVEAHATWLICATVCVPEQARFRLDLPAGDGAPGAQAGLFAAAAARTPRPSPFAAHVSADGVLWLDAPHLPVRDAWFFPAEAGVIDQGAPQALTVSADTVSVALKPLKRPLGAISGVLRLVDLGGQVTNLAVSASPVALPAGTAGVSGAADASGTATNLPAGAPANPQGANPQAGLATTSHAADKAGASGTAINLPAGPKTTSQAANAASNLPAGMATTSQMTGAASDPPAGAPTNPPAGAPTNPVAGAPTDPPAGASSNAASLSPGSGMAGAAPGPATGAAPGPDAASAPAGGADAAGPGLLQALLLAFAGGLILNLMPCVLPVLAIKAVALARMSATSRTQVRREAAFYTAGVVLAFCVIGAATLGARAAGAAVGWGVQFQSAVFTTAVGWLLFATGLNMSGVFMVGARAAGVGEGFAARGSFATGLLAVVVATPCTAPFMGAALAAALSLPALAGMLVFVALGLGLAAPYVALALSPRAARLLPRPGAWMEVFRNVLAFPMYAAALWMVWVAAQQTGQAGLALVFASFLLVGFAAWAYGAVQARQDGAGRLARLLSWSAAGSLAVALVLLAALGRAAPAALAAPGGVASDGSEPYSPARLASLRAAHRPVLVDMTASWCVTCLVNEQVALAPNSVRAAFARHHVGYLKGDWTRQDANVTAFLRRYDRSGVPLYVFYPAQGAPEVLPQILTPGLVLARLER